MELLQSPQKYFLRHKYPGTFLFYRFNQSVQSPTRYLELVFRRQFFFFGGGLWNSSIEVLVILVRIRIFKCPNSALEQVDFPFFWKIICCTSDSIVVGHYKPLLVLSIFDLMNFALGGLRSKFFNPSPGVKSHKYFFQIYIKRRAQNH